MTRLAVYEHVLELVAMWFWRSLWKVVGNFRLEILECYGQQMSFRELFIKMLTFSCVRSLLWQHQLVLNQLNKTIKNRMF